MLPWPDSSRWGPASSPASARWACGLPDRGRPGALRSNQPGNIVFWAPHHTPSMRLQRAAAARPQSRTCELPLQEAELREPRGCGLSIPPSHTLAAWPPPQQQGPRGDRRGICSTGRGAPNTGDCGGGQFVELRPCLTSQRKLPVRPPCRTPSMRCPFPLPSSPAAHRLPSHSRLCPADAVLGVGTAGHACLGCHRGCRQIDAPTSVGGRGWAGLTCPGGRRRSPRCASRSQRNKKSQAVSPALSFAWRNWDKTGRAHPGENLPEEGRSWLSPVPPGPRGQVPLLPASRAPQPRTGTARNLPSTPPRCSARRPVAPPP